MATPTPGKPVTRGKRSGAQRAATSDARGRILEVAKGLFAAKGYAGVSMREIAAASQLTLPTLYHHFGDKRGLFLACRGAVLGDAAAQVRAALDHVDAFAETFEVAGHLERDGSAAEDDETLGQLRRVEDLDGLPPEWFEFCHLCDAPGEIPADVEKMTHILRAARSYVGEGGINPAATLAHLPPLIYSIELPNEREEVERGAEGHARRCLETAKAYFAQPAA